MTPPQRPRVVLVSIEPWDEVWRRNQHLASRLVQDGYASELVFVTPPAGGLALRARRWSPQPGITVVTPPLLVPRRFGGHRLVHRWLRREARSADVIWINDPVAGAAFVDDSRPLTYDVTDDWSATAQARGDLARIVAAEDRLAGAARTVVCSPTLQERWGDRYGIEPVVIPNGVDVDAIRTAKPRHLTGNGPHAVYVGTLHENRLDCDLVAEIARTWPGTLHLVGPIGLPEAYVSSLREAGVDLPGAVPSEDVPGWLTAADVLICPHKVDTFTMSLDAIKSHEYLATDHPIVATASSGFQTMRAPGLRVVDRESFSEALIAAAHDGTSPRAGSVSWDIRTAEFAAALGISS